MQSVITVEKVLPFQDKIKSFLVEVGKFEKIKRNKMAEEMEIEIPEFDGKDYKLWKKRVTLFLRYKECNEVITREKLSSDNEKWDKNDLKAMKYICSVISSKELEFVKNEKTAYGIIKKFDSLYLKESMASEIMCENNCEKLKSENYEECSTFLGDFGKTVNGLNCAGATVFENGKSDYMLNTMSEKNNYGNMDEIIGTLKEEEKIVNFVKNKIEN